MYPIHNDDRGSFQELARSKDVEFGQLGIIEINPKHTRGGHYHTRKREWFCCIEGKCDLLLINTLNKSRKVLTLNSNRREFELVNQHEMHWLINQNGELCKVLSITSEEFNANNADTYTGGIDVN